MMEENVTEGVQCDPKDVEDNKGITFLSYIGILCLIPLLTKKDSKFAQYHAKQGLVVLIYFVIVSIIYVIPVIGWVLGVLGYISGWVFAIMGLIAVSKGECKELPIIGKFASKFKI